MSTPVTLKSFPFDSMQVLNEESNQMEDDRLYEAKIFRQYFAKFLSNGVYYGHYKNYGENGMKVSLDNGLTIKVNKGCGIINGADYELESDALFVLERPTSGERKDRVVVRVDDTLAVRETQLYIKAGTGTTPATLQRDDNIYEICLAEVTVKSTSNLTDTDIVDTRLDKTLCGIVDSLISIDGEELYQQFQNYIESIKSNLVLKNQNNTITGNLEFLGDVDFSQNTTGIIKALTEYLYQIVYVNNTNLTNSLLGMSYNCIELYLSRTDNTASNTTTRGYYYSQIDSLFMNYIRYLISILPNENIYKGKLSNWLNNVLYIKQNNYDAIANLTCAQVIGELAMVSENGTYTNSTIQNILNNDKSLPDLLLRLRNSL